MSTMLRVDPLTYAVVLPTLLVAHNVADHVVQTDHQAASKATSWRGMAGHVGTYHVVQVGALLALRGLAGVRPSWGRTVAGVAFSALSHAFLDRRWPVVALLRRTGSAGFAAPKIQVDGYGRAHTGGMPTSVTATGPLPLHGPYLADQALHHGCLAVAAAAIAWRTKR